MEALSWGSTYRNSTNAQAAIAFPFHRPGSWPVSATAYLLPWFNGGCPWVLEHLSAFSPSDSVDLPFGRSTTSPLFGWPLLLPKQEGLQVFP